MKLKGFSIAWRPKPDSPHVFYHDILWDDSTAQALVFETHDEALTFLAGIGLNGDEDAKVVEVTLNTRGFKSE